MKHIFNFFIFILSMFVQYSSAQVPVEDYFKHADIRSATISPGGDYFAAVVDKEGKFRLVIIDLATRKPISVMSLTNKRSIGSVSWANDERYFFNVLEKIGFLAQPVSTGELLAGNVDGTKQGVIIGAKSGMKGASNGARYPITPIDPLIDNKKFSIVQETKADGFSEIYKLNVYTGKKRKLDSIPSQFARVLADNDSVVRFSVGSKVDKSIDENVTLVHYRDNEDEDWKLIQVRREDESGMTPIAFTKNNKQVYVQLFDDISKGVYLYDPTTQKTKPLWENKSNVDIAGYIWDNDIRKQVPIGVRLNDGKPRIEFFDDAHPIAKIYRQLESAFEGQFVQIYNYTKDGKTALMNVFSDKNPGSLYKVDLNNFSVEYILSSRPWINADQMLETKPISFKARDGLEIHGYLTLPQQKSKNLPMVLKVHGGPYGVRDNWNWDPEDQFLASRGYAVLKVNYRGSGGYGRKFQYGSYRMMGAEMQDDLTDATMWAINQGIADKERVCIYGGSYGGYASLMGVVKEPDLYKCAIPYVGVFDIELMNRKGDIPRRESGRRFLRRAWGDNEKFFFERSPINHLDKMKAALFIVHGEEDERADFSHYLALSEKLDEMGYPYESMVKDKEGHGFYLEKNRYELYTRMAVFLDKHIGDSKK